MSPAPGQASGIGDRLRAGDPYRGQQLSERQRREIRARMRNPRPAATYTRLAAAAVLAGLAIGVVWTVWSSGSGQLPPSLPLPESPAGAPSAPPTIEMPVSPVRLEPSGWSPHRAAPLARPPTARAPRAFQFTAPGGTRILWTLDPEFTLPGENP